MFGLATGTGTPTDDYGADVLAGARLVRGQIQPIADVGWSRVFWSNQRFGVDTFRLGGKVAAGGFITDGLLDAPLEPFLPLRTADEDRRAIAPAARGA